MDINDIDFGSSQATPTQETTPAGDGGNKPNEDVTPLDGVKDKADLTPDNNGSSNGEGDNSNSGEGKTGDDANNFSTGELKPGEQIEYEDTLYTVADNGDLVDDQGNVFKKAEEVKNWLASVEVEDENPLSIESIQETIGIDVTDENGKKIEFTNDANGVKAYVDSVINLKSNEIAQGAVNKLFADNPLVKQFIDYVQLNGTPRGFGEIPDRSGITLDKDNENQLIAVIKMAAQEFGNKSMNDAYIKYLKDTGSLYDVANEQLQALVEKDKAFRKEIETRAAAERDEENKAVFEYWNKVNKVINSRTIAGYKLPESFVKEVNGQKQTLTPNDFYNYLSKQTVVDADGNRMTGYQKDLNDMSDDDLLNKELLDAWLLYTGGTYKDLVDMAIKEEKVKVLRVIAKNQRNTKPIKVTPKANDKKVDFNDIMF